MSDRPIVYREAETAFLLWLGAYAEQHGSGARFVIAITPQLRAAFEAGALWASKQQWSFDR